MITKNIVRLVASLKQQKFRKEHQLFVVEGRKMVNELMDSPFETVFLFVTEKYLSENGLPNVTAEIATETQMEQMSGQDTAPGILAVVRQDPCKLHPVQGRLVLALDGIANPGNMGTIIRTAEWFGLLDIVCSKDCVELWNPKVIQATMGSIFRTRIAYTELDDYLASQKAAGRTIYGALLDGENLFERQGKNEGIIVIGSESHGIRPNILPYITRPITIPRGDNSRAESLNASIASAIIMAEMTIGR